MGPSKRRDTLSSGKPAISVVEYGLFLRHLNLQVSTARIGTSPETGVVDANLKVFGVQGLRIADASIFPSQIAAHTSATVIAIGERASELIISAA